MTALCCIGSCLRKATSLVYIGYGSVYICDECYNKRSDSLRESDSQKRELEKRFNAACMLIITMWSSVNIWAGERASSHFRSEIAARIKEITGIEAI